jgi:hypothetical protein
LNSKTRRPLPTRLVARTKHSSFALSKSLAAIIFCRVEKRAGQGASFARNVFTTFSAVRFSFFRVNSPDVVRRASGWRAEVFSLNGRCSYP